MEGLKTQKLNCFGGVFKFIFELHASLLHLEQEIANNLRLTPGITFPEVSLDELFEQGFVLLGLYELYFAENAHIIAYQNTTGFQGGIPVKAPVFAVDLAR